MKVDDFYPFIAPEVPGVPYEIMRRAVMRACKQLCEQTMALELLSDPMPLQDGQADYDIDILPGARTYTVKQVWAGGRQLTPATLEQIALLAPDWDVAKNTLPIHYNMVKGFGILTVYPTPVAPIVAELKVRAVYTVKDSGDVIPDPVVNEYQAALEYGSKAYLMAMAKQPWTDLQMASTYLQMFNGELSRIRGDILHNRVPGSLQMQPRRFR